MFLRWAIGQFNMNVLPAYSRIDHARHFFQLAQMASDDLFAPLFGARSAAVLESMFLAADNDFSHLNTRFLLADEEIAGLLHAYPARYAKANSQRTLWLMLRYARLEIFRFFMLAFALRDIFAFMDDRLESDDLYIAMLAIYPEFRGRGFSKALLTQAHQLALERSCSRLALDVDKRNTIARAAYRSAGFTPVAESKDVKLNGESLQLLRMVKPVGLGV